MERIKIKNYFFCLLSFVHLFQIYAQGDVDQILLQGYTSTVAASYLQSVIPAYTISNPSISVQGYYGAATASIQSLIFQGKTDFALLSSLTAAQTAANPNVISIPIATVATVFPYNLPSSVGTSTLVFSRNSIYRILTANITMWNDPQLVKENPSLTLPAAPITFIAATGSTGTTFVSMVRALSKFNPAYNPPPVVNNVVQWSKVGYAKVIVASSSTTGVTSAVVNTPYSIGLSIQYACDALQVPYPSILNSVGQPVPPNAQSLGVAMVELGTSPITSGIYAGVDYDITAPNADFAYPFGIVQYLNIVYDYERSTCATGSALIQFLTWLYTSSTSISIGSQNDYYIIPDIVQSQIGILATLNSQTSCENNPLIISLKSQVATRGLDISNGNVLSLLYKFYNQFDLSTNYSMVLDIPERAIDQIIVGEIDIATASVSHLSYELDSPNLVVLPLWLSTTSPYVNVPLNKQLRLSVLILAKIFLGQIASWFDPSILELNPTLKESFQSNNQNPNITVVLCCSSSSLLRNSNSFFHSLNNSLVRLYNNNNNNFITSLPSGIFNTPFDYTQITKLKYNNTNFIIVSNEARISVTVDNTPGAIGYTVVTSSSISALTYPSVVSYDTANNQIDSIADSKGLSNCIQTNNLPSAVNNPWSSSSNSLINMADSRLMNGYNNPSCFPFTETISALVLNNYMDTSANNCQQANKTLSLVQWLLTVPSIGPAIRLYGGVPLRDFTQYQKSLMNSIDSIRCVSVSSGSSDTILVRQPVIWSLNTAIYSFFLAGSCIGILLTIISTICLYIYRAKPVFKSSSPSMLGLIILGIATLFGSCIAYIFGPDVQYACDSWYWLINIGFTLTFGPLFIKTWRIYQIFNRKVLRVIKISDFKLIIGVLIHLSIQFLLLTIQQATNPIQQSQYILTDSSNRNYIYSLCLPANEKQLGLIIFLGTEKGLLLLFGSIMGFSTRRVASTFNESSNVAWSIYSVVFSCLIIIPIAIWIRAVGDALVLLVSFLTLWGAFVTYSFMFAVKMYQVTIDQDEVYSMESARSISDGFSFISLAALSDEQLPRYLGALKKQVMAVEKLLKTKLPLGNKDSKNNGIIIKNGSKGDANNSVENNIITSYPKSMMNNKLYSTGSKNNSIINSFQNLKNIPNEPNEPKTPIGPGSPPLPNSTQSAYYSSSARVVDPKVIGRVNNNGIGGHSPPTPLGPTVLSSMASVPSIPAIPAISAIRASTIAMPPASIQLSNRANTPELLVPQTLGFISGNNSDHELNVNHHSSSHANNGSGLLNHNRENRDRVDSPTRLNLLLANKALLANNDNSIGTHIKVVNSK